MAGLGQVVPQGLAPSGRPARRWLSRRRLLLAALSGAGAVGLVLAGLFVHYTIVFPDPLSVRGKERAPVVRILARDGAVLAERGAAHEYMPIDLLPAHVTNAVVAIEDRRFLDHWGLDPIGLVRAAFVNLRAGRFAQGGSTLTQQLAKNLFLTPERTLARKLEELALALWLELRLSKQDILELYLNRVYFGAGAYGIEAAAQRYFDKSARELTLAESALIAGLLKAPSKYSPSANPGEARARASVVLGAMRAAGLIGPRELATARQQPIRFATNKADREAGGVEYAVDYVLERLPPLVGTGHAEVVVETTIDADLQRRAHEAVVRHLKARGAALDASQAAMVVLDTDGGIRALVGGRDYAESQFNRATKARRQPGSTFKPFVYLAALEQGLTPESTVYDLPLDIAGWAPRNDNGQHLGALTLRQALAQSVNTVAVRLAVDAGPDRVARIAERLGVTASLRAEASLALGTSEVPLIELAGAYGTFANGGSAIEVHSIRRVRLSSGRVLFARQAPRMRQVVAPRDVASMNDMLNAALVAGTGRRAGLPRHPAAGKTGTSQDFRDAWFVGYTAHLVAGVWLGNDDGRPMRKVVGGSLPADIWREVMLAAHAGKAPLALPGTNGPASPTNGDSSPPIARTDEPETLPWQVPRESPSPLATATARAAKPQPRIHPNERISEDFIARALAGDGAASPTATTGTTRFDAEDIARRLSTAPTPPPRDGLMSLGGR
ncbi:MAG: PBP1A family penicillin-binding protein [Pseudomonadota bacterium]